MYRICVISIFAVTTLLVTTAWSHAQLELSMTLSHATYLQYEPIVARTTVRSKMGQPMVLNSRPEGPTFYYEVKDAYGFILEPLGPRAIPEPIMVPPQSSLVLTNNILSLFPMAKTGFYSVEPCIDWRGKTYRGQKLHVEVVSGREVIRTAGIAASDQTSRTYLILHVNRGHQDQIALRIDDDERNLCFGVFPLGRTIINTTPELAVDIDGNAHVLFQAAPNIYVHAKYSPFGTLIEQESYGQNFSKVRLQTRVNGGIEAVGQPVERGGPRMINSIINNR